MSSRTRALKAAGIADLFVGMTPAEQQHLARRATAVPNKKKVAAKRACRGRHQAD